MCLILFAHRCHPRYRLVVAANRDEFHARPSAVAGYWGDAPEVLAGRDLEAGGTWLGITRRGRFAAVTNYREPGRQVDGARSRGALVGEFLTGAESARDHLDAVAADGERCNGFSLVADDGDDCGWCSNRGGGAAMLAPGVYGLCNHLLDTPWPKLVRGREALREIVSTHDRIDAAELLATLDQRQPAPAASLPDTGIEPAWERALSALFVSAPGYGTRCSTAVLVGYDGEVTFVERSFDAAGVACDERAFTFTVVPRAGITRASGGSA